VLNDVSILQMFSSRSNILSSPYTEPQGVLS